MNQIDIPPTSPLQIATMPTSPTTPPISPTPTSPTSPLEIEAIDFGGDKQITKKRPKRGNKNKGEQDSPKTKLVAQHYSTTIFSKVKTQTDLVDPDQILFYVKNGKFIGETQNLLLSSVKHVVTVNIPFNDDLEDVLLRLKLVDALSEQESRCTTSNTLRTKNQRVLYGSCICEFDKSPNKKMDCLESCVEFRFRESTSINKRPYILVLEITNNFELIASFNSEPFNVVWRDPAKKKEVRENNAKKSNAKKSNEKKRKIDSVLEPYERPSPLKKKKLDLQVENTLSKSKQSQTNEKRGPSLDMIEKELQFQEPTTQEVVQKESAYSLDRLYAFGGSVQEVENGSGKSGVLGRLAQPKQRSLNNQSQSAPVAMNHFVVPPQPPIYAHGYPIYPPPYQFQQFANQPFTNQQFANQQFPNSYYPPYIGQQYNYNALCYGSQRRNSDSKRTPQKRN